ncbi:MAG: lysine--tRNA ligase, partial [Longimicrobiales bacterium]|nr:lysine--tRNA ligase [Longimicrobiales bacterium]
MDSTSTEELNQVRQARIGKLRELRERGIEPYAYDYDPTHSSAEARGLFEEAEEADDLDKDGHGETVSLAGRMVSWRAHGKSAFADLEDESGRIQLYFRKDVLGDEAFEELDLLDLGDWIGVEGPLFRTRMGEVTIRVASYRLLSKSLRPLPLGKVEVDEETGERVVHSGFADTESRYRQRYADLAVHPEVRDVFRTRARMIKALRDFMDGRGFLEVETPALQPLYGGATARPFVTHHNTLDRKLFLRIADELYLKRLIVGGFERVYEIAKDFRNEGIDRSHNPEFTMLEFYQAYADYREMMDLVEELLTRVAEETTGGSVVTFQENEIRFEAPFRRISFLEALGEALGTDPAGLDDGQLRDRAEELGIPELGGAGRGKLLDKLFGELVEPDLIQPTFVLDYPRELSPLAKARRDGAGKGAGTGSAGASGRSRADEGGGSDSVELTERFELYVASMEIANAFSELNDPIDQRRRFEEQTRLGAEGDEEAHQIDEDYIRALEYGMPPTGGVGIGVDRLAMILTDQ